MIYITLFIIIPITLLMLQREQRSTCVDGKQNQGEEGVDCGGPCGACVEKNIAENDIVIEKSYVVYGGENKYDVITKIINPNALYGGKNVYYTMDLLDANNVVLDTRKGVTFVLPNQNKYIVEVGLTTTAKPARLEMSVEKVDWIQFKEFSSPQIIVKNQRVGLSENDINYAQAYGLVVNDSMYDFHDVVINVLVFDERNVPIAVNKTVQKTLDAHAQREFLLNWPHQFPGTIKSVTMQAETNIFDSLNFMKKYSPVEYTTQYSEQ